MASGCSCNPRVVRAAPCRDCSKTPVIQNERTLCSNRIRFWCCTVNSGDGSDGSDRPLACTLIGTGVIGLLWGTGAAVQYAEVIGNEPAVACTGAVTGEAISSIG